VSRLRDIAVLTGRNLVHIAREPLQLSDVTVQPVLFTALFVYVFGAGVVLPNGRSYTDYAIAGLLALNLDDVVDGDGRRAQHRSLDRHHRAVPDAADVAPRRARRPVAGRPDDRRALHRDRRAHRPCDRLATRRRPAPGARRVVALLVAFAPLATTLYRRRTTE
jgi:hypothetical protein